MTLNEIIGGGCGGAVIILSLIQIAPVKINPWSAIVKAIAKCANAETLRMIEEINGTVTEIKTEQNSIRGQLRDVKAHMEKEKAVTCRVRILRFSDELYMDTKHTKEHFDQIVEDITQYELYVENNPEFRNGITTIASENIKSTYRHCMDQQLFL